MDIPSSELPQTFLQSYRVPIVIGAIATSFLMFSIIIFIKTYQNNSDVIYVSHQDVAQSSPSASLKGYAIDIEGGVHAPGMYILPSDSRVEDAIKKAGGFSENADMQKISSMVNRAQKIVDGMKIYIPVKGNEGNIPNLKSANVSGKSGTSYNSEILSRRDNTSYNILLGDVIGMKTISINNASQSELESLSGVGPATASKIIAGRPYESLEALTLKKVIGAALFDKIKSQLSL